MTLRVDSALEQGIRRIRTELGVPAGFPAAAAMEAVVAARTEPGADHVDRTDRPFVTLDPSDAIDLDQAFAIERSGGDLILHYAIADVGWFVEPGSPLDEEAWRRGVTVYLPDQKARLYPAALSEGAASLLPDGPRPAVVFTTRVDGGGDVRLEGAERAVVHSRAKLAYDTVGPGDLPDGFSDLAARIEAAEDRRGAPRVEFPDQELELVDGSWVLRIEPRREFEDHNSALSLATNLAVAGALLEAGSGLFRVMAEPTAREVERLRHTATAFGLRWPHDQSLADFRRTLHRGDPGANAFLDRHAPRRWRRFLRRARQWQRGSSLALGDRCFVRPRDGTAAPAGRSVRGRRNGGGGVRASGPRARSHGIRFFAAGDGAG